MVNIIVNEVVSMDSDTAWKRILHTESRISPASRSPDLLHRQLRVSAGARHGCNACSTDQANKSPTRWHSAPDTAESPHSGVGSLWPTLPVRGPRFRNDERSDATGEQSTAAEPVNSSRRPATAVRKAQTEREHQAAAEYRVHGAQPCEAPDIAPNFEIDTSLLEAAGEAEQAAATGGSRDRGAKAAAQAVAASTATAGGATEGGATKGGATAEKAVQIKTTVGGMVLAKYTDSSQNWKPALVVCDQGAQGLLLCFEGHQHTILVPQSRIRAKVSRKKKAGDKELLAELQGMDQPNKLQGKTELSKFDRLDLNGDGQVLPGAVW